MKNIQKIFVVHVLMVSSLYASEQQEFKVLSFNIDTNIGRTEEGYARESHSEWRVNARMPSIQAKLQEIMAQHSPDVIQLQEGRAFVNKFGEQVDSVTPLVEFLSAQNYEVLVKPYNPSDRAFSYITAFKRDKFAVTQQEIFYLTQTPEKITDRSLPLEEIKKNNYGEEWERCIYIVSLRDTHGQEYRVRNVHLGLGELHRTKACEMLASDSKAVATNHPDVLEVTTGDFNTFPDWGGPAQLEAMKKGGVLQEVTQDLRLPNGKSFHATFIAFPYDFAANEQRLIKQFAQSQQEQLKVDPQHKVVTLAAAFAAMSPADRKVKIGEIFNTECKAIGGHLDRVYQRGFGDASVTLIPTPLFSDFDHDDVTEEKVKGFIMRHYDQGPAFASDHQPLLVKCTVPKK